MISNITRATSATELASNPKSFFNCPDLHGGVPSLPGGSRPREIRLLAATSKHRALQKSKRLRNANNEKPFLVAAHTLERTKRLILAAIRVWELKQGIRA